MNPELRAAFDACVPDEGAIVVALGGGADSAVLLATAVDARRSADVRAVFVNHSLESSPLLADAAGRLADQLHVHLDILVGTVDDGPNLEERARDIRYRVIADHLADGEVCCTGHTADDQAETVLMRLMRGSGPHGLACIPKARHPFYRPLLEVSRADLRRTADGAGLPYVDDPANNDIRFFRSKIRSELIPAIESEYASGFRENLVRTSDIVAADAAILDTQAEAIPVSFGNGRASLPVAAILTAPGPVATRAIRRALGFHHHPHHGSFDDVAQALSTATDGTARTLSSEVQCWREGPLLNFAAKTSERPVTPQQVTLGQTITWDDERFVVRTFDRPSDLLLNDIRTAINVDSDAKIGIRAPREGDTIAIESGSTPVTEVLRAGGVPVHERGNWMLITVGDDIAAVRGLRVASWARAVSGQEAIVIEREGHS